MSNKFLVMNTFCLPYQLKNSGSSRHLFTQTNNQFYRLVEVFDLNTHYPLFYFHTWSYHSLVWMIKTLPDQDVFIRLRGSFGKKYFISYKGILYDSFKRCFANTIIDKNGDVKYVLSYKRKHLLIRADRLVAENFYRELRGKRYKIEHIDYDKTNNCMFNFRFKFESGEKYFNH